MKLFAILILIFGYSSAQFDECIDPPGNNAVAQLIADGLEAIRPFMTTGVPELGIPPFDPLGPLFDIPFHIDVPHVVKMDGSVNDTLIMNFAQFVTCSVNISIGVRQKFDIELKLKNFHMEGLYDVDGLIASLFPVFGHGDYRIDTFNASMLGGAKVSYNPFNDHASIKDLIFDIDFSTLDMELECILGCGEMADLVNSVASEMAPPMFFAVWDAVNPLVTSTVETVINNVLANISISGLLPDFNNTDFVIEDEDLGNANFYMNLVLGLVGEAIELEHLDPASLPNATFSLELQSQTELFNGELFGLSSIARTGTCTVDTVADWKFLYANIGFESFFVSYDGIATGSDGTVRDIKVSGQIEGMSIYFTARTDTYQDKFDLDQFIISEFGKIDIEVQGLGVLGFLEEAIIQVVANSVRGSISELIGGEIKDIIQDALHETPWN